MSGNPWAQGRILAGGARPRVLFGRMYEDPGVELSVFPPPGARVLCVASAGDTAAALAGAGYEVTAVDVNPVQLEYARGRLERGAPAVDGTAERMLATGRAAAAALLPAWRRPSLERFLRLDDPFEQARQWRTSLDGPGLRLLMGAALRPAGAMAAALRPAFRGVVPARFDLALRRRIAGGVSRHPNARNPWAWRLLLGHEILPAAKPAGPPVKLVEADVAGHLERVAPGTYDAVTLSNVLDGPGPAFARRLRAAVRHAVRPGGVAVLRSFREPAASGPGRAADERSMLWGVVRVIGL
ncbi:BtaA family protein [Planotetraspora sp. A-T 1434]|uniref:BtaA family protein n=1 Tax=Planotetraspora sp. A-T 1434 TaxID=2979219 RepID=UPI0021C0C71E|nr:BtaA family protein [Planotetraspora sp. A-T 1434]MCT9930769.1 BtaA family protein [Planotetraspora sp. A-T 1434]